MDHSAREVVYQELFHKRLMEHLDIGTTPQYFRLSRVYWWTLYYLGIEPQMYDTTTLTEVTK